MPTPGRSNVGDRLHVCVGADCNNNCIFCMEDDRASRRERLLAQTDEDVRRMMTVDPSVREVMFTSGEPTLHPRLPQYVAMARDMGFDIVGMITNGRRLGYRPYLRSLLEAGLNHILISIHGPDAATHDALVRTKGAFQQALVGLANLVLLRREFKVKVHTSYVVNKRNYKLFREFFDVMRPFGIDQHVFNVMMPDGRGGKFFDQLMPRYSDVADSFGTFVEGLTRAESERVFLLDIPYCTTDRLPDHVRGYVERYFHFEPDGSVVKAAGADEVGGEPEQDELFEKSAIEGEGKKGYSKVAKSLRDREVRGKRPECARCGYEDHCRGVFHVYIDRFGWDEFVPVRRRAGVGG